MAVALNPAPRDALVRVAGTLSEKELLDSRAFTSAILDEGVGGLPETDLLIASHRQGVAREVSSAANGKLSKKEQRRLKAAASNALRTVSEEGITYIIDAWSEAFAASSTASKTARDTTTQTGTATNPTQSKESKPSNQQVASGTEQPISETIQEALAALAVLVLGGAFIIHAIALVLWLKGR